MILNSLLILLSLGLTHSNDDVMPPSKNRSYLDGTLFHPCLGTSTTHVPTTLPVHSTLSPTTVFSTTMPPSTTVSTSQPTSENPSSSAAVPGETTVLSTSVPSTVGTSLPMELTTSVSTESETASSSTTISTGISTTMVETSTIADLASSTGTSGTVSTSSSISTQATSSSAPTSASSTQPTTPIPTSAFSSSISLFTILSSSSTAPSSPFSSTKVPTTTTTTNLPSSTTVPVVPSSTSSLPTSSVPQSSPSSSSSRIVSPSTPLASSSTSQRATSVTSTSTGILSTLLTERTTTPGATTTATEKDFPTTQDDSTTVASSTVPSTVSLSTTLSEGSSPVQTTILTEETIFSSSTSSDISSTGQGEPTSTMTTVGSESTVILTSEKLPSSTSAPDSLTSTSVTSTLSADSTEARTTVGAIEVTESTEDTSTATVPTSASSSTTDSIQTTPSEPSSTSTTAEPDHPTSSENSPTTRAPIIQMRRTAPGQQQGHPETSSELPATTVNGTTESNVASPVSTAATLTEILSGRRYVTPAQPAVQTTPTTSIPTPSEFPETSSSPVSSSTVITTGISSKKPTTPWELPMTVVQTTEKLILSGRRYVTPEKIGKATTVANVETTVLSTVGTTVFAPGSSEKTGTTTVSDSTSTGMAALIEASFSIPSSTQSVLPSTASTAGQTSVATYPSLTTTTESVSSRSVTSSSVSSSAGTTSTMETTIETETATTLTSKAAVETTVQPPTTRPATTSTGTWATEKETAEIETTSASQTTTQELEITSLPFSSTAPSRVEEFLSTTEPTTSPTFSSGNERSETSTGTTSGPTTLPPKISGQGCEERCPEGSLAGSGRCYQLAPANYQPSFHLSFSYCGRDRVGHLIEKEELMEDVLLIREWMRSMDFAANTSIYVGPFVTVGSQVRGEYTNLSRVSGAMVPTEVIKMQEIRNFVGICAMPEFCRTFNCSFLPLYKSLQGLLTEPMPAPVSPGTAVAVQCLSPSDTLLNLKCDSYGKFNPRPGTASVSCRVSRQFSREMEVPDNKPIRKTCDCYQDGTETCQAVEGGFRCQCKKGWLKNRCWKSDDACWVPAGNVNKCNNHGKCHSYPDVFVCECDPGFGGATCSLNVTNVTWFGSSDSVPFWTAGKAVTVVVTGVEWAEMCLKAALKSSSLISSNGPTDPLSYTSSMRKFTVAAAGVGMILYGHPHFYFDLWGFGCRLVFLLVNIAMLFAFWLLIMESFTTFTVYYGWGRNRWILGVEKAKDGSWSEVDEPEDKWFLAKPFTIYLGVAYAFLVEFYLFTWFFDSIPSPYTCLGEIYSLRNPATMVNLEIMAIMAYMAAGFGILAQVSKRLWPEVIAEQYSFYEFHKGRTAVEVLNKVERCQHLQLVQAPVIFLNYGFAVWSQDQVASGLPQTFEFYFSIPLMCFSVLLSAIGVVSYSPFIYGHVMKAFLPRLPWLRVWTQYTPAEHGYFSHSEVINRKQSRDVVLPENEDWPKHPSEKAYIALERRHQCLRRLTRQYLEMRLMGVVKNDALELIAGRFLLAIPEGDPESRQWQYLLKKWTRDVRRIDGTNFEIPRNRAENKDVYFNRVMGASLFTRADVMRENSDWMRFLYLFQLLGHIPLEKANGPRSCQQIRHHSQFPEYRAAWDLKKETENWPEIAMILSPELYPDLEKIEKVRGGARQKHTILVDLPAVDRYLWGDFLNRAFFGWEQVKIRNAATKDQIIEEPIEHRLEQIRLHVLERRVVPRTITHLGRAEWLAGHDLITIYQPSAAILIGANDQPREAVNIPPLIIERHGIPTSLYRW